MQCCSLYCDIEVCMYGADRFYRWIIQRQHTIYIFDCVQGQLHDNIPVSLRFSTMKIMNSKPL